MRWRRGKHHAAHERSDRHPHCHFDETVDELLELAWILEEEEGTTDVRELASRDGDGFESHFAAAAGENLVESADGAFRLTAHGRERAREVIRAHRLAEMLLTSVLEMSTDGAEQDACRFEHILSPQATDSICTLMGHPPTCPHGKPIPRGRCCELSRTDLAPIVVPLTELHPGDSARIVFIAPRSHARLDRLTSYGIVPGGTVKLHQKQPAFVLKIGETDVALDASVAKEIFVKRA